MKSRFDSYGRREFIKSFGQSLLAGLLAPLTASCGAFKSEFGALPLSSRSTSNSETQSAIAQQLQAAKKSNVLFLAVDDLNDWISPLGGYYGVSFTPNFDRLANRSVTFKNAYCSVPWCDPSRASTLTGLSPATSTFYGQTDNASDYPALSSAETLPAYFKRNGYTTMGAGKVFHGWYLYGAGASNDYNDGGQSRQPWDQYQNFAPEPRPSTGPNNGLNTPFGNFDWASQFDPDEESMPDMIMSRWGANLLNQNYSQPFFMALGLYRPHLPWYVPKKYYSLYPISNVILPSYLLNNDLSHLPAFAQGWAGNSGDQANIDAVDDSSHLHWRAGVQAYLASISFADKCLGVILDALEKSPHANNTTIVLWSDNGFQLGEKRAWRKFKLWEKAARVPMFVSLPGGLNAGKVCTRPVSLLDVYPTLTDICNNEIPAILEGNSLSPLLLDPSRDWSYGALTSYSQNNDATQIHRSVRTDHFRYIRYFDGSEELYDHRVDPHELANLLYSPNSSSREIANALSALLPNTLY